MAKLPPPLYDPVTDEDGKAQLSWANFFQNTFTGDKGTVWIPTFTSLTEVGTPTITGRYYKLLSGLVYFWVQIVPGTSTSSTAGTTFINNFPLNINNNGACFALTGGLGSGSGHAVSGTKTIFTPAWSAVTATLTVVGLIEAS
jgi:hypothetical protein